MSGHQNRLINDLTWKLNDANAEIARLRALCQRCKTVLVVEQLDSIYPKLRDDLKEAIENEPT